MRRLVNMLTCPSVVAAVAVINVQFITVVDKPPQVMYSHDHQQQAVMHDSTDTTEYRASIMG